MQIIGIILAIIFIGAALFFKGSDSSCDCDNNDNDEEDCDPWTDPTCPDYWIYGPGANRDEDN